MPVLNQWGPFAPNLDTCERRARLRSLRAIVGIYLGDEPGQTGAILSRMLAAAEETPDDFDHSRFMALFDGLGSINRRRIMMSCIRLTEPTAPRLV